MDDSSLDDANGESETATKASLNRTKCSYCRSPYLATNDDPTSTPRPLMKCAGCLTAHYCSKEHQRLDWKRHKALCKTIQAKLAAVAAAEAEAQLEHGASVIPSPKGGIGLFPKRRYGSNTQLCLDQREQQLHAAALANVSVESSCRSSTTGSPPMDSYGDGGGSASSSVHGSMADLISSTSYHTSKGGRYSIVRTIGNPKRARFPLTVIRERRSSIGSGEAARLAAAAAAAAGKSGPQRNESESEDEEMDMSYTPEMVIGRKRPATAMLRHHSAAYAERPHMPADRCASDADAAMAARMAPLAGKKDHRCNPILDLFTDPRFQLDAMVPRHTAFVLRVRRLAVCVASALREYGWCVVDHFLGETHAKAIYNETTSLYMTPGLFADGQLMKSAPPSAGPAAHLSSSKDVRSDQIYWFDNRVDRGVHISFLVSMVDSIVYHLSEHIPPYRVNGRSRAMIACYPGRGTKYVRHVDNPDRDGRCVTTIYYLNEHWKREHGGSLRMYPESSSGSVDIEPLFDRLLFFWSDRRNPHEVLPSYQNRFAITIWYFDAAERAEALAREQQQQQQEQAAAHAQMLQAAASEKHQHSSIHHHHHHHFDPSVIALKLAEAEQHRRTTPRSASCAELSGVANAHSPTSTSTSTSLHSAMQEAMAKRDSPSGSSFNSLAQLQQHLRLDSPRQSNTSSPASGYASNPSTAPKRPVWTTGEGESSFSDYSLLLPNDVISKLISLSTERRNSQDQDPQQECDGRSSFTSPAASPEIDPISDN